MQNKRLDSGMDLHNLTNEQLNDVLVEAKAEALRMGNDIIKAEADAAVKGELDTDWHRRITCAKRHMQLLQKRVCVEQSKRETTGKSYPETFTRIAQEQLAPETYERLRVETTRAMAS